MTTTSASKSPSTMQDRRWRTRDIVVAAVVGVAFGVVFWIWNIAWGGPLDVIFAFAPPLKDLGYAVWLVPAVLAPLIVRKPGAAIFAETVAAGVSAILGSQWGIDALLSGLIQGAGAEIVFALFAYRTWTFPVLALAALGSAVAAWIHDWVLYYPTVSFELQLLRGLLMAVSAVVIVAGGSLLLHRALHDAGALEGFPD
jgi:energy-coupling factor transport system permease protein